MLYATLLSCIAFARCRAILAQDMPGPIHQKGIAEVRISINNDA
jgi:hypothetical protein